MTIALTVLLVSTSIAAAIDVRSRTIPNALTAAAALAALAVHAPAGLAAVAFSVATMIVIFLIGSVAFAAGWLGGGDVKLIAAACGLVGYGGTPWLVADILIAGAVLVIVSAAARGRLFTLFRTTAAVAMHGAVPVRAHAVPYGLAIAAGSAVYTATIVVPFLRFSV